MNSNMLLILIQSFKTKPKKLASPRKKSFQKCPNLQPMDILLQRGCSVYASSTVVSIICNVFAAAEQIFANFDIFFKLEKLEKLMKSSFQQIFNEIRRGQGFLG